MVEQFRFLFDDLNCIKFAVIVVSLALARRILGKPSLKAIIDAARSFFKELRPENWAQGVNLLLVVLFGAALILSLFPGPRDFFFAGGAGSSYGPSVILGGFFAFVFLVCPRFTKGF